MVVASIPLQVPAPPDTLGAVAVYIITVLLFVIASLVSAAVAYWRHAEARLAAKTAELIAALESKDHEFKTLIESRDRAASVAEETQRARWTAVVQANRDSHEDQIDKVTAIFEKTIKLIEDQNVRLSDRIKEQSDISRQIMVNQAETAEILRSLVTIVKEK